MIYLGRKPSGSKSPLLAAALNFYPLLPFGHLYAGRLTRGLVFAGATLGASLVGASSIQEDEFGNTELDTGSPAFWLGYGTGVTAWIWSIVDAHRITQQHNQRLLESQFGLQLRHAGDAPVIALGFRF